MYQPECSPGDIVFVTSQCSKHEARSPYIVTGTPADNPLKVNIRKVLHSHTSKLTPKISPDKKTVDRKFLFKPARRESWDKSEYVSDKEEVITDDDGEEDDWSEDENYGGEMGENEIWDPTPSYGDEDFYFQSPTIPQEDDINGMDVQVADNDAIEDEHVIVQDTGDEYRLHLNQAWEPRAGDRIILFNEKIGRWMLVTLTSDKNKYYLKHGNYFNFRGRDKVKGGQYLDTGGLWGLILNDVDEEAIDLDNIVPLLGGRIVQVDGGGTPGSLTPEGASASQHEDIEIYGIEYLDDEYVDPGCELSLENNDYVYDEQFSFHINDEPVGDNSGESRLNSLAQQVDFDIPDATAQVMQSKKWSFYPTLRNTCRDLDRVHRLPELPRRARTRLLSRSTPNVFESEQPRSEVHSWSDRVWRFFRRFRRRRNQ